MKVLAGVLLAGTIGLPSIGLAQDPVASRVQGALDTRLVQPECKLDGGDFRVGSGKTYLKTGIEGSGDPSNRVNALKNGVRVITEAITTAGQGKSSAAWYWLARTYLQQGDLAGADSAFTRAQALASGCKEDIRTYRYRAWATLVNAGGQFRQAKQEDSAMIVYRAANRIFGDSPLSFVNLADIFVTANQTDSALYYFGRAAATEPSEPAMRKLRNQALFNHAVLLLNAGRPKEAILILQQYLELQPDDLTAQKALARAFRAAGMTDSAQVVERALVAGAGGDGAGGADEGLSDDDLFEVATRQYNDKNYAEAAATYTRLLRRNPNHRNALNAQANSYLALQDGAGLIGAAERLVAIDPLGEFNFQLLAQGYKFEKKQDKLATTIIAQFALPVDLQYGDFATSADNATFTARAVGREARDENNKVLASHPVTIIFEFLGKDGTVLETRESSIPALKTAEVATVEIKSSAGAARAWRYRLK